MKERIRITSRIKIRIRIKTNPAVLCLDHRISGNLNGIFDIF